MGPSGPVGGDRGYGKFTQTERADAARRANQVIRTRTVLVMALLGVVTFGALFLKLFNLQIRQHDELQEKAVAQQTRSTVITASRGTIYDRNGQSSGGVRYG